MNSKLRTDAELIARGAISAVCPDEAVQRALKNIVFSGKLYIVAVGKAAWQMASAALKYLEYPVQSGIVLTKYGHSKGSLPNLTCLEAGHPVPDENSYLGTREILAMTDRLAEDDTVLFLLSGGGSSLFELPLISPEILSSVTSQLLGSGAGIVEINTIRKRLSAVKGGRFAQWCAPARVESIILSDILGDPVDMIASGPAAADTSTSTQAITIAEKYAISSPEIIDLLKKETPKALPNVHTQIVGSVRELCHAAGKIAAGLGYEVIFLTDQMDGEASEEGRKIAAILNEYRAHGKKYAILAGGETVVHLKGTGLGGRNQELALSAAEKLASVPNSCIISVGSDGTDGPTDAAGGYADTDTLAELTAVGLDYRAMLANNDSYHALKAVDGLIITGPTGTNVNDVTIGLLG